MFTNLLGTIIIPSAIAVAVILLMAMSRSVQYQCDNCGGIFSLSPFIAVAAPHMMGKKFVRCPRCGIVSWVSPMHRER